MHSGDIKFKPPPPRMKKKKKKFCFFDVVFLNFKIERRKWVQNVRIFVFYYVLKKKKFDGPQIGPILGPKLSSDKYGDILMSISAWIH